MRDDDIYAGMYAIQLMAWRLDIVEGLEGAVRHLEYIEGLEATVAHWKEIERDPVSAFERFEEIIPTVENPRIDPIERFLAIESAGLKAIKDLKKTKRLTPLEHLGAIKWRAERGGGWADRSYTRFLLLGGFTEDCSPLVMLRLLTVGICECDQLMRPENYDNYRQRPPEELADYLWDTLEDQVDVCENVMDMEEKWEKWTTGQAFRFWEVAYY